MPDNFGDKRNTNGLDKNPENINRAGRPISIKNELKELLLKEGELPIPASNFIKKTTIKNKEYYIFKIPTKNALATRLITMAMSKNSNGFNALKLLLETFDGKATQQVEQTTKTTILELPKDFDYSKPPK